MKQLTQHDLDAALTYAFQSGWSPHTLEEEAFLTLGAHRMLLFLELRGFVTVEAQKT